MERRFSSVLLSFTVFKCPGAVRSARAKRHHPPTSTSVPPGLPRDPGPRRRLPPPSQAASAGARARPSGTGERARRADRGRTRDAGSCCRTGRAGRALAAETTWTPGLDGRRCPPICRQLKPHPSCCASGPAFTKRIRPRCAGDRGISKQGRRHGKPGPWVRRTPAGCP
jgi:hypothetical protein